MLTKILSTVRQCILYLNNACLDNFVFHSLFRKKYTKFTKTTLFVDCSSMPNPQTRQNHIFRFIRILSCGQTLLLTENIISTNDLNYKTKFSVEKEDLPRYFYHAVDGVCLSVDIMALLRIKIQAADHSVLLAWSALKL
jgi:hypothetical protein